MKLKNNNKFFDFQPVDNPVFGRIETSFKNKAEPEIYVSGPIMTQAEVEWYGDGISSKQFDQVLKDIGSVRNIRLRVNSDGGSVTEAKAMYNMLQRNPAYVTAEIEAIAASAASFLVMAADKIRMGESDFVMIHKATAGVIGTAAQIINFGETVAKIDDMIIDLYQARTGQSRNKLNAWMEDETYFNGREALKYGFVDEIDPNKQKVAACLSHNVNLQNLPDGIKPNRARAQALLERNGIHV